MLGTLRFDLSYCIKTIFNSIFEAKSCLSHTELRPAVISRAAIIAVRTSISHHVNHSDVDDDADDYLWKVNDEKARRRCPAATVECQTPLLLRRRSSASTRYSLTIGDTWGYFGTSHVGTLWDAIS